VEQGG